MSCPDRQPDAPSDIRIRINRYIAATPEIAVKISPEERDRMWHQMLQARRDRLVTYSATFGAPLGGDAA